MRRDGSQFGLKHLLKKRRSREQPPINQPTEVEGSRGGGGDTWEEPLRFALSVGARPSNHLRGTPAGRSRAACRRAAPNRCEAAKAEGSSAFPPQVTHFQPAAI